MPLQRTAAKRLSSFAIYVVMWVYFLHGRLVLAVDNTACIDVAHDVGVSARTKHFDRAIHYFRDLTQLRRVVPTHVTTDLQRADGYTKSLSKAAFVSWMRCIYHD